MQYQLKSRLMLKFLLMNQSMMKFQLKMTWKKMIWRKTNTKNKTISILKLSYENLNRK